MAFVPRRRKIASVLVALAIPLASSATAGAADNPPLTEIPQTAASVQCSPIIVYASRGANENPDSPSLRAPGQTESGGAKPRSKYYDGLGEELLPVYTQLRDTYAPGTVGLVTNRAPRETNLMGATDPQGPAEGAGFRAVGPQFTLSAFYDYALSVNEGKQAAIRDLTQIHERCPDSKLVVMGYSAGAEVTRRALASLPWKPEPGQAMAIVFGDVLWKAGEKNLSYVGDTAIDQVGAIRATKEGDFGLSFSLLGFKIASIPKWPSGWNATTYCHGGDLACQLRSGTLLAHESYHDEDALGASYRIAAYLGGPYVRPVIVAKLYSSRSCFRRAANVGTGFKVLNPTPGAQVRIDAQWEMTPFVPFKPIVLSAERPEARRGFFSGLFPRLRIEVDGHKLDYRNVCG